MASEYPEIAAALRKRVEGEVRFDKYSRLLYSTDASWLCYFHALKLGNASQVAPIDKLNVVLVALLGVTFLSERLSPAK